MHIVLGLENLTAFGGTETYAMTVAGELEQLGHDVTLHAPNRGAVAEFAGRQGLRVVGAERLPNACDLVIASDAATCHELAGRGLGPVVFVAHSADHMLQAPPQLGDRCQTIVVLNDRVRRAVEARAWRAPVVRLRQPIDLLRYCNLGPPGRTARTALVTSNYVDGARGELIEAACRANGLRVAWIGATTRATATPEFAIADADLVIGLGRSVLEAMAAGRAAYVYGVVGGDGWVTPERYPAMEGDGFAGTSAPEIVIDADRMARELGGWTAQMGEIGRDLASAHHSAREHAVALVDLARGLTSSPPAEVSPTREFAHLVRLQWRSEHRADGGLRELARLRARVGELEDEVEAARARAGEAEAGLAFLRATRRVRLAGRVAAPLDRLRKHVRAP